MLIVLQEVAEQWLSSIREEWMFLTKVHVLFYIWPFIAAFGRHFSNSRAVELFRDLMMKDRSFFPFALIQSADLGPYYA